MKLISLQLVGKGLEGWYSDELVFGEHVTHLWGPNGCGKTPIVQSLAFCLGFPCVFRQEIYERVGYALLKLEVKGKSLTIKRMIDREVDIQVTENEGNSQNFYNEDEYSDYLFDVLGLERPEILSTAQKPVKPYLSTLLPLVYLDQDDGYRSHYYTKSPFIKDQFEEMVRVAFRLPPKNSFNKRKKRIVAKENVDRLDKSVHAAKRRYFNQKELVQEVKASPGDIREEIESLDSELENLKTSYSSHDDSLNALDKIISNHKRQIRVIENEINEVSIRNEGIVKVIEEINTEVDTLNLNEEARRIFAHSSEICGSSACKMFANSSASYSKNLLYLKDQIKDLERNSEADNRRVDELKRRKASIEELAKDIVVERNAAIDRSEASVLVDTISEIKNRLFELQSQLQRVEELERIEEAYSSLLIEQRRAIDTLESLSSNRNKVPEVLKLKSTLKQLIVKWLSAIRTINVSLDIKWKSDFIPLFGVESIDQIKGSTKARVVLGYHAALIELILERSHSDLGFIILDTPKQHEIHDDDLNNFMNALKDLCKKYSLQVIFSTTEYKYNGDEQDTCWVPRFPGPEQNMFLTTR